MKSHILLEDIGYQPVPFRDLAGLIESSFGDGSVEVIGEADARSFPVSVAADRFGSWIKLALTEVPATGIDWAARSGRRKGLTWISAWSGALRRAGYATAPTDAEHLARLLRIRRTRGARVEVALDTSAVLAGGPHYLSRLLGDRLDLLRVDAVHREIAEFRRDSYQYLVGNRALEILPHPHPKWRRLDVEDAALLLAKNSDGKNKRGDVDLLVLRAVAKWVRDSVPGISRFFATADGDLSRRALHELPAGSLLHFLQVDVQPEDVCSPLLWIPGPDQGFGMVSNLSWLVWEALSVCDEVTLRQPSRSIAIRAFLLGRSGTASMWRDGVLWWKETVAASASANAAPVVETAGGNVERPDGDPATEAQVRETLRSVASLPAAAEAEGGAAMPRVGVGLRKAIPSPAAQGPVKGSRSHRPYMKLVCDWLSQIAELVRAGEHAFQVRQDLSRSTIEHHVGIFEAVDLLAGPPDALVLGPRAFELAEDVAANDLDQISTLFEHHITYAALRQGLRERRSLASSDLRDLLGAAARNWPVVARQLGQAVMVEGNLLMEGGKQVDARDLLIWLEGTVGDVAATNPLGQAPITVIARRALEELHVAPYRLGVLLSRCMDAGGLGSLRMIRGGTPERVLVERVVRFDRDGWGLVDVSADGLLGWRAFAPSREA